MQNWRQVFSFEADHRYVIVQQYYGHHQVGGAKVVKKTIQAPNLFDAYVKEFTGNTPEEFAEDMGFDLAAMKLSDTVFIGEMEEGGNFDNEDYSYTIYKDGQKLFSGESGFSEEEEFAV